MSDIIPLHEVPPPVMEQFKRDLGEPLPDDFEVRLVAGEYWGKCSYEMKSRLNIPLPDAGGMWAEQRGPEPEAHKSVHDYQEQLKAKRRRKRRK